MREPLFAALGYLQVASLKTLNQSQQEMIRLAIAVISDVIEESQKRKG